jgi:hypothetical protein
MASQQPDWFEQITGFKEAPYQQTQARLSVEDGRLVSAQSDRRCRVGRLETPTLAELRARVAAGPGIEGRLRDSVVRGDVRQLHARPENHGALFQVASQFNVLELVGPSVTPEHGVTRYVSDPTQGPACAMAAGAATIYRNYLTPLSGAKGQTADRQIDCLRDLGHALGNEDGSLWEMRNGYALLTEPALQQIDRRLRAMDETALDALRGLLRVGLHWDVEVTDVPEGGQVVSQAFCSAMPVSYQSFRNGAAWERLATLVLEAAYEATLLAAALNRQRGGSGRAYLTRLGGGAFGNRGEWIDAAMARAMRLAGGWDLEAVVVRWSG